MRNLLCAFVLGGLLLAAPALRAQDLQILLTGQFHKGVVTAESGQTWYGLFPDGNKFRLLRTIVQVTPVRDDCAGDKEDEKTASLVSCDKPGEPLFLVRGIPGLEEREVHTEFHGKKYFYPGQSLELKEGDKSIRFTAFGSFLENGTSWVDDFHDFSIKYQLPGKDWDTFHTFVQFKSLSENEEKPNLIWAGNLDNDGKLDMFWDMSGHYNIQNLTLFLSSFYGADGLFKKVAEIIRIGC